MSTGSSDDWVIIKATRAGGRFHNLWQSGEECNLTVSDKDGTSWAKKIYRPHNGPISRFACVQGDPEQIVNGANSSGMAPAIPPNKLKEIVAAVLVEGSDRLNNCTIPRAIVSRTVRWYCGISRMILTTHTTQTCKKWLLPPWPPWNQVLRPTWCARGVHGGLNAIPVIP